MSPRDWDAATYERNAAPLTAMGEDVLDRLVLAGDETVLDAGCGTGNVTRLLLERLPAGRVIAVDAAPSMVEQARALLPAGTDVRRADLLELDLGEQVDAVLSTATFHWVTDHDLLFRNLHDVLKPGGRLVAQCGGAGNVAAVKAAGLDVARRAALRRALRRLGDRVGLRHARGDHAAPGAGRLQRRLVLAHAGRRRPRGPGRLPARDLPRPVRRPAAGGPARAVRRRRAGAALRPAPDPLRAPEHPRPRLSPGL